MLNFFFDWREKIIDFFRNYSFILSEAKYKAKYWRGLKMLSLKQMLQRLPIALAQVKVGNPSESLLNELRQIIYCLCWTKEIAKKVCKSMQGMLRVLKHLILTYYSSIFQIK